MLLAAGCSGDEPSATPPASSPTASASPTPTPSPTPSPTPEPSESPTPSPSPSPTAEPTPAPTPEPTPTPAPTPYTGQPRTYDEAVALVGRASGSQEVSQFFSPTGNLFCVLDSPYLPPACELGRGAIPDSTACPDDGPSQNVGRIELTDAGPQPVCNSDTIRDPDAPTLGYGTAATWPGTSISCVIERFGATCIDPSTSRGFFLAKNRYRIF